ncbi:MAG: lipase family alpha/beta hydrolase [Microgenomates group bacterium]
MSIFDWKLNPFVREYDGIINTVKNLGFVENQDFYVFPYDWRKNLDQSSEDLKNFINSKIPQQEKKINLIGHSLGGLLARIFTQKYKERVNKVITVGSPHQGAVQVYKPLSAGEIDRENTFLWLAQKIILILNKTSIETDRETLRKKFPVAYDLFPTFNFLKNQQNQEIPTENLSIKNNLLTAYNQTFSQIFDIFTAFYGEKDNQTPAGYVVTQANLFHQTLGNYQDGQPVDIYYEPGDYTVLSKSANKDTDSEKLNFDHGEIITKRESIKKILNKIDLFPEDGQIEEGRKTKISPSLIFLIKSPVKMTLKTPDSQLIEETDGIIFLDNPQSGNYQLQLQGIEKGKYTLIIGQITNQNDIWEIKEGEISQTPPSSQTDRYNFYFNNNLANPIFPTPTPTATLIPTPTITPTPTPTLILISTPTITPTSNSSFANQSPTQSQNNHSSISSNNSPTNLLSQNAAPMSLSRASKNNKSEVLGAQNKKSNNQKINNNNNKNKQKYLIIVGFLISLSLIFTAFLSLRKFKKNVDPEGIEPSTFRM